MHQLIDQETLASLKDLQSEDDPDFLKNYFTLFIDSIPELLNQIRVAVKNQNFNQLEMSAHALKSSSANSGVLKINTLSSELEMLGRNQSVELAAQKCDQLDALFKELQEEIQKLPEFIKK